MGIKCSDILSLTSLKSLKLVGGSLGIERTIRWVYVAECFDYTNNISNWIFGGELVFMTGHGLNQNYRALFDLVNSLNDKDIAGIIINVGPYIPEIPPEIIKLADELMLPLFELPWEVKLIEVTRDICTAITQEELKENTPENLLENILFNRIKSGDELMQLASRCEIDLSGDCSVGIMDIDGFALFIKERNITDERKISDIRSCLLNAANEVFTKHNIKILTMSKNNSIIFLIRYNSSEKQWLKKVLDEIRADVSYRFKGINISAGIGKSYSNINDLRNSYKQAEQALKAAKCECLVNTTYLYNELGIFIILQNINDKQLLDKYYQETFKPVIEYDKNNNTKLLDTLNVYINENCNILESSRILFIHKNTLIYRLHKIEELLECDLKNVHHLAGYIIGFTIAKLKQM